MQHRINGIQSHLKKNEALIVISEANRLYFTGFSSSAGTLLITKNSAEFFIDFRYFEKAVKSIRHCNVSLANRLYEQLREYMKAHGIDRVYVESSYITLEQFKSFQSKMPDCTFSIDDEFDRLILQLRSKKTSDELSYIKAAQKITDETFAYILDRIHGRTEREIMLDMEFYMRKQGSEGIAFDTIVVSGKNSSLPHGVPSNKCVESGDFVTIDFGAVVNGYCADMTRTIAVGQVNEQQFHVYHTVLSAQEAALSAIAPGKVCRTIDNTARSYIAESGFGDYFGHGLGHSVGIEIHETPCFNTVDETRLAPGMVLTVEPGIYLPDQFGVRIEDMVYITENGYENLTASPKNLIII